jgi:hypothetical protein
MPENIDADMNTRIRSEGIDRSKIMWIEHYLTDVYGPRPTGSPNHLAAANWALNTMTAWGMRNTHLEPFTWRGIGWLPGRASGFITSPVKAGLKFEAIPWSPSTKGTIAGEVLQIVAPQNPTEAELTALLTDFAPRMKGAIVMIGAAPNAPVNFNEPQKRLVDDEVKASYAGGNARGGGGGRGRGATAPEGHLSAPQVGLRLAAFLRDNPPAFRILPSGAGRVPGVIVAQNGSGQTYEETSQISPGVILRNDDYGRMARLLADGTPVSVEFTISNQYFPDGRTSYIAVGEIPGTDKAAEVVMLGGHLDSWASATGATDNAIGCAIMLEAARILEAVGARPRRTIRVALWSGEEQGLLGSIAYVQQHFGMAEAPKPEHAALDAYWNIDDGTGRVRGATIFGPPEAGLILAQIFKPFEEWGVYGASTTTSRMTGGTDSTSFNQAGLPGIGTRQDPIEYNSTTWHTNLDNYERIVPDDVMKNAVITASVMYHLANRDAMLPRFPANEMPPIPPARGAGGGAGAPGGAPGGAGAAAAAAPAVTATSRVFLIAKGQPLTVAAPGLITPAGRGGGAGSSPETATLGTTPKSGKVIVKADGSFVYTPNAAFAGTDTFTFTVTSSAGTSTPATVTVIVR